MKIAFDVDDTLWMVVRDKKNPSYGRQVPDYDLIQVLKWFYNNGDTLYIWSAGGVEYAQQIAEKLGIAHMLTAIPKVALGDDSNPYKIDIAFDDCETKLAKVDVLIKRGVEEVDKDNL